MWGLLILGDLLKTCYRTLPIPVSRVAMGRYCASVSMGFHLKCPMKLSWWIWGEIFICTSIWQRQECCTLQPRNILWGVAHNVHIVPKHGFEMYLAKYISKPEPSLKINLPEECSDTPQFFRIHVVGSVEVLMCSSASTGIKCRGKLIFCDWA